MKLLIILQPQSIN